MDMGWGVGTDETYENQLEDWLNSHASKFGISRRYEVLNFAMAAYSPLHRLETFRRKALKYRPDLVLYSATMLDPRLLEIHVRNLLQERLDLRYDFLRRAVGEARIGPRDLRLDAFGDLRDKESLKLRLRPHLWDVVDATVGELADECRAEGIPLAMLLVPRVGPADAPDARGPSVRKFGEIARERGVRAHRPVGHVRRPRPLHDRDRPLGRPPQRPRPQAPLQGHRPRPRRRRGPVSPHLRGLAAASLKIIHIKELIMSKDARILSDLLAQSAARWPHRVAVKDEHGRSLTFEQLRLAADRVATRLNRWGVGRGDRVGLFLPKGLEAVAAIHGILRGGAAYVPVDPTGPAARGAGILADCGVKTAIVAAPLANALREAWPGPGPCPRFVIVGGGATESPDASWDEIQGDDAPSPLPPDRDADDLAYILYTSGSTGRPKGVMISHENASCFLDWCERNLGLADGDRFSSHAPFHFDLSIFDLFASCRRGGTIVLIGEALGRDPARLAAFLAENPVDVWYSAPSILSLLVDHGRIDGPGFAPPRVVLFAGEVFPIRPLKRLRSAWPEAALWNLYGPTETNVCTAFRLPRAIDPGRVEPFPIGRACEPLKARVVSGELWISGPGVMKGYFGRTDLTAAAMVRDGESWYRTGDLVEDDGSGCYLFKGRRDRMVKRRGHRIELGEIESALQRHDDVETAAVVARTDGEGLAIAAFVAVKPGRKASIIAMKRHCTMYLPHYMIPDRVNFLPSLPTTSTDKVDYQELARRDL